MSTKPTIALARFADTGGADVTAPSSGLRDTGFVAGTPISQSFVNELFKQGYLWDQYLNDGALTGNHTITGTLGVSSALTVTSGGLVVSAGGAAITGTLAVTGAATVSTTLGVTGAATVGGTLGVTGATTLAALTANGALNTAGLITEAGVVSATLNSATNNDDFTATGFATASVIRFSTSSGAAPLGGLDVSVANNRVETLVNVSTANITIKHESGTSSAQFRFACPNSADVVVRPNGAVRAWYDTTSLRWRLLAI